ncbi:DTW domain-containing protein [Marinomonas sp. C2222]|uniref:tRNA-uridine aminocarboxypropyltransferase n=1 Tax=Marinomonas sargassi TaxID=2984494 RepID=A0ABT2YV27_9GAMM|nr:tRNA-uridine aminocarboxypropyltransferase [Marinomonas sargassi]MCV2403733.1 DTW domain-containing protein [Marinomonas sargassi]
MKIWLLTHSEELKKTTGTGPLVKELLKHECEIIEWSRVEPNQKIIELSAEDTVLIYPSDSMENSTVHSTSIVNNIIIIDGTWQQARKIYNRSPYLKAFPHYEIQGESSIYSKRQNQKNTGLCTAEVAIYSLKQREHPMADELLNHFLEFNS